MKKAFPFYRSYYDQLQYLEDTQIAIMVVNICKVQFFELHIDHVYFEDKMTKLAWAGIKHSIQKSIDGYCSKLGIDYDIALAKVVDKGLGNKKKNKDNEEVKDEEKSLAISTVEIESDALKVATYLLQKILLNKPNFKKPDIKVWEKDISKAIKLDRRTIEQLIGCIDWIYSLEGNFWIPIILSGKKLREKFDVMESQMMNHPKNNRRNKTAQILERKGYGNGRKS